MKVKKLDEKEQEEMIESSDTLPVWMGKRGIARNEKKWFSKSCRRQFCFNVSKQFDI